MVGGFPDGIAPPTNPQPYYNATSTVQLRIRGGTTAVGGAMLRMINSTCANPKKLWQTVMSSVPWPSEAQLARLRAASQLCEERLAVRTYASTGEQIVEVTLEAYAAAELVVA